MMPAKATKQKTENVPELRFPDFEGGWKEKKLGDIAKVTTGSANREDSHNEGKYKFFDRSVDSRWSDKYSFDDEALIVAGEGLEFSPRYFSGKFDLHQRAYAILKEGSSISWKYLYYFVTFNRRWFNRMAVGSTMPSLRMDAFNKMEVSIPVCEEQQKIAGFLGSVDEWVENLKKQKENLEAYKKGMMQRIFSQEIRFKDDDGNDFPDWEEKKLGEMADLKNGYAFKSAKYVNDGNYKIITIGNIQSGRLNTEEVKTIDILPDDLRKYQILQIGDLLISMTGNVGRMCLVDVDNCLLNQRVGKIVFNKKIDKNFVFHRLNSVDFEFRMRALAQGGAQDNISKTDILSFKFDVPDIKEQQKIAEFLTSLDNLIESKEKQISAAEEWKKGLMQKMFV